jgi:hypothetical protein
MTTGISGQKTCILRIDEKYDATWHHWAGKGYEPHLNKITVRKFSLKVSRTNVHVL